MSWFHGASHLSQVPWREVEGHYSPVSMYLCDVSMYVCDVSMYVCDVSMYVCEVSTKTRPSFDQDAPTSSARHLQELVPLLCYNDFVYHLFCCAGQITTRVKFWYESHSVRLYMYMYSLSQLELNLKPTRFHKEFAVTVIMCPA